jgi:DNA helicase-2/ATP-dependent DNA helicase PcrA
MDRIPYRIFGSVSFYKRKEIKDAVAYLRFIRNDQDTESLLRVINFPPRKIGEVSIGKLRDYALLNNSSLYEAILKAEEADFPARLRNALQGFIAVIEQLKDIAKEGSVYDVLSTLYESTGITSLLQAENTPESMARYENLQELLSMARDFSDHNEGTNGLNDFLNGISLATDYEDVQEDDNYVSLMTVHAAKGLEFPVVFITGLEERLFPLNYYEADELEEERRLFYVAVTRAQQKVFLSWAKSRYYYGQPQTCLKSMFIDEVDSSILVTESGKKQRDGGVSDKKQNVEPYNGRASVPSSVSKSGENSGTGERSSGLKSGMRVHHAMFGPGIVLSVQGAGERQKAKIKFRNVGEKTLMVQYANLTVEQ